MKKWTVIGYYIDNDQPWMVFVEAETPVAAAIAAIAKQKTQSDQAAVVEVLEGHQDGHLCNETVAFAPELMVLREEEVAACSKTKPQQHDPRES